jgi:hypothetical protein
MPRTLSEEEKDELRQSFSQPGFSVEAAVVKLMRKGFEEATARILIAAEFREYKKNLFHKTVKKNDQEEVKKVISIVIIMVSMIGPVFNIKSLLWYMVAIVIAGAAGFWGYKPKPVAGLLGSIVVAVVYPFAYAAYFSGRTSYITIEMIIPMIMAVVPAVIVYFIISAIVYTNTENY